MSTDHDRARLLDLLREARGEWVAMPALGAAMGEGYTGRQLGADLRWLEARGLCSRRFCGRGPWWRRAGEARAL